jgi:hypothetical protein
VLISVLCGKFYDSSALFTRKPALITGSVQSLDGSFYLLFEIEVAVSSVKNRSGGMKGFFLGLFLLFPLVTLAAVRVSFSDEITKDSLDKLERKIRRAGANLKENQERIIQIDIDSGGGNLYATMDFVKNVASLMTELNVQINTRVAYDC